MEKKSGIFGVFGVLGSSGLRILLSYFWPAPLQRPKEKKKTTIFFFDRQWVQTRAKPLFIEIEIEKKSIFGRKKIDPKLPQNDTPPNARQFRKNRKKMCRNCIWLRFFARKSQKQWLKPRDPPASLRAARNAATSSKRRGGTLGQTKNGGGGAF